MWDLEQRVEETEAKVDRLEFLFGQFRIQTNTILRRMERMELLIIWPKIK